MKKHYIFTIFPLLLLFVGAKKTVAQTDSIMVYVFLSETCPICQNQTLSLRDLNDDFAPKGIKIIGVFPNIEMSDSTSIFRFKKKYKLNFGVQLDDNQLLSSKLQASVTPQVFVVRKNTQEILYEGKIDNSFERVGKRRQIITDFYLRDALTQIIQNQCVTLKKTEPVGCFIQKK
jgi:peroxiredoxin